MSIYTFTLNTPLALMEINTEITKFYKQHNYIILLTINIIFLWHAVLMTARSAIGAQ